MKWNVLNLLYFNFDFTGEESQYIQSFFHDEGSNKKDPAAGAKAHFQLARALAVLQIKASTFHSLHIAGRHDKVSKKPWSDPNLNKIENSVKIVFHPLNFCEFTYIDRKFMLNLESNFYHITEL